MVPALLGPLVPVEAEPPQAVEDGLQRPLHYARLIGVLDAHDERAAAVPGEQPVEQGGPDVADVGESGWAGREAHPNARGAHCSQSPQKGAPPPQPILASSNG